MQPTVPDLHHLLQRFVRLSCCLLTEVWVAAAAEAPGQLSANLDFVGRGVVGKRLGICVNGPELDALRKWRDR